MDNFDNTRQIAIIWDIDDVHDLGYCLTDEEAMEVLLFCKDNHDATMGISWDTLEYAVEFLFYDKVFIKRNE